jgi:hypothetical protein
MKPFLSFGKVKNSSGTIHKQCKFITTPDVITLSGNQRTMADVLAETASTLPAGKSISIDLPKNVHVSWDSYDFMGPELTVTRNEHSEVSLILMWESEHADLVWIEGPAALFAGIDDPVWHATQVGVTDGALFSEEAISF